MRSRGYSALLCRGSSTSGHDAALMKAIEGRAFGKLRFCAQRSYVLVKGSPGQARSW
jgi:hypothetical protein